MSFNTIRTAFMSFGSALACLLSGTSLAYQTPSQSTESVETTSGGFNEIVITASRREQNLQDVGISVTAFGGKALEELGVRQTIDIVGQVPGLRMNQYSSASPVFNIRGVSQNSFDDHLETPVAVYIDDAYVAFAGAQSVPTFDIERVEVLRGPQGTLFGRNATGGLIHFISKRPTKELDGYVDLMGGTHGHANVEGAISGPLAENVQARLAGAYTYRRPYLRNDMGNGGQGLNNYAFRGQLAFQPSETLNVLLMGRYSRNDNEKQTTPVGVPAYPDADGLGLYVRPDENPWGTCNGCDAVGWRDADGKPYTVSADTAGTFNRKLYGGQARIEWDLGGVSLISITDAIWNRRTTFSDDDGSPNPLFEDHYYQRSRQISEELRLSGEAENFRWTTGFYYLNSRSRNGFYLTSFTDYRSGYDALMRTKSWSLFGQVEYDLTPSLTLIGGLRYVEDKKIADVHSRETFDGFTTAELIFNPTTYPDLAKRKWSDYAARVQLNYKVNEGVLLYASFNRGIKGPNFIAQAFTPFIAENAPHDGETLLAYEAGVKSSLFDRRVRLNLSGFIYDYNDYQAYSYKDLVSAIRNKPASAMGLEAELTVIPVEGLTISSGLSAMKSKVKDVELPSGRVVDTDLPQSPGISGNVVVNYETPVSDALKVSANFAMTWSDHFTFGLFPAEVNKEPGYAAGNLRLSISDIGDRWSISAFGNNIWKELYRTYTLDSSAFGSVANHYVEPRWFGLELRYKFGA